MRRMELYVQIDNTLEQFHRGGFHSAVEASAAIALLVANYLSQDFCTVDACGDLAFGNGLCLQHGGVN